VTAVPLPHAGGVGETDAEKKVDAQLPAQRKPEAAASASTSGWQRLVLRSRHGIDHDCTVLDARKEQLFHIASGFVLRTKGELRSRDRDGEVLYLLRGQLLDLPRQITISRPAGAAVARVRVVRRSAEPSTARVRLTDEGELQLTGELDRRHYVLSEHGTPLIRVDQKSVQIRDSCKVDVADGTDPALAAALVWAIDELLEDWG
jgi:uncharacterized protein YxjI